MNQIITNSNKEFVTLLMNFIECNFNTQCNHVHAVSIKVLAFCFRPKYRFFFNLCIIIVKKEVLRRLLSNV